jgi:hypothetical protein
MGVVIGTGITIEGGITISVESGPLRNVLSPTGQAAYDAAVTDGWFSVSATDYGNVQAGLTGVTTLGYTAANLDAATTGFSQNFGATLNDVNATVNTGNYILGLASRATGSSGTLTFRPYVSTTFRGTYSTVGTGNLVMSQSAAPTYWIRKNPTTAVASTSYVAVGVPLAGSVRGWGSMGPWGGANLQGGAYSSTMASGSWTTFNSNVPAQQWLVTNVQQW